jgi:hypothetical protein
LQLLAQRLHPPQHPSGVACLGHRAGLISKRQCLRAIPLSAFELSEREDRRRHARHEAELASQPKRFLEPLARGVDTTGRPLGEPEMPRGVGEREVVPCLSREFIRPAQRRERRFAVATDDLLEAADPEQRLALTRTSPSVP